MKTRTPVSTGKESAPLLAVAETAAALQKSSLRAPLRVPKERRQFRDLILSNPNYFGTVPGSIMKPILPLAGNTTYEELGCVGYNPETEQLHAVVVVKQPSGYTTGLCGAGSPEYVRFYIWDEAAANWVDQGVTQAIAHDMAHAEPLNYAVTLNIQPAHKPCLQANLLRVKAILSWHDLPAANAPDYIPVWGESKEVVIQIRPLELKLPHFDPKLPLIKVPGLVDVIMPKVTPVLHDWKALVEKTQVQPARVAAAFKSYLSLQPQTSTIAVNAQLESIPKLATGLTNLFSLQEDKSYEELTCVGLNHPLNTLVATLVVKKPQGYMTGLCGPGSREYVAFWVDWNDGAGWTYTGTNSVLVHDIAEMPDGGIHYAVTLPVNTASYTAPCTAGPRIYKVRAVLSWELPPATDDPNWLPHWGNHVDADIQVQPGPAVEAGQHKPFVETVGGMATSSINADGLANGPAVMAGFVATDSPFGGLVVLTGHISNPPAPADLPLKYRIMVSDDDGATYHPLTNKFPIWVSQFNGVDWIGPAKETQTPDANGWYTYREAAPSQFVAGNVLAWWYTPPHEDVRKLRMDVKEPDGDIILGTQIITVALDNTAPAISFTLDTAGGTPCGLFEPGDTISGSYKVTDAHLSTIAIHVDPHDVAVGAVATFSTPTSYPYPAVTTTGNGDWQVTGLIDPCGYVITLQAWDRTIVNSGAVGFYNHESKGLCVREAVSQ